MRFLFLFSDTGGGHRRAAEAVRDEMSDLYGEALAIDLVDAFVDLGRWPLDHVPAWYPSMVRMRGIPWGVAFHALDRRGLVQALSRMTFPIIRPSLERLIRQHPSDLIVTFHPVPNPFLIKTLNAMNLKTPVATVVLDLINAHAFWFSPGLEAYFVPLEETKARALRWGLSPERVEVRGMPVHHRFIEARRLAKVEARARLGLPQQTGLVLMVGGGEGIGPLAAVVQAIASHRPHAYLAAIAGHNSILHQQLSRLEAAAPIHVEGFVSNMEIWMRAADILVTKAGPNTLAEAFLMGLPTVLYAAIPGQEEGNVAYVLKNGIGFWAPEPAQAARAVLHLLHEPGLRKRMAARAYALAHPGATRDIARRLWSLAESRKAQHILSGRQMLSIRS